MSPRRVWKYLGVGVIGAVVGIGSLMTAVVLVLPLFASTLQPQDINLADIGCPAGMNEDMSVGRCAVTPQSFTVLSYATEGINGLDILKDKPEPSAIRDFASKVDDDDRLSFKLYRIAALLGDAESQFIVGGMYSNGKGTEEDDMESLRWLHESAHGGYRKAQVRLAYMLSKGEFVEKNDVEAVHWLKRTRKSGRSKLAKNTGI